MATSGKDVSPAITALRPDLSIAHTTPAHRVTSVLLNGKNFHAWSNSFRLFLGGKRKIGWLLGKEQSPGESDPTYEEWYTDNCIILGWMFNSMDERVYNMFMYHRTVFDLWTALNQMYAHAHSDSRIFELYQDISHASQATLGLSVGDYFGYLQTRWEELAQYEPLSDFPNDGAVESKRLDRRHTYQFLMGLKPEFEALRTQILNTVPLPSLFEAFATVDGDERRRRIISTSSVASPSPPIPEQMAFAAPSGLRPTGSRFFCDHCHKPGHTIDRCFTLHPELKQQFARSRPPPAGRGGRGRGAPRTGAVVEVTPMSLPDFGQLQSQISQLQSHLGLGASSSSGSTAAIATGTPTALHGKSAQPTWILDSGANNHMTGESSVFVSPFTPIDQSVCIADGTTVPVHSQGNAHLSSDITLSSVYFVPNFAYNLLSVNRLAKDHNCAVVFLSNCC